MTLKSKSKVCRLDKSSRMELGCAIMTLMSKINVFRLDKKCRMEL